MKQSGKIQEIIELYDLHKPVEFEKLKDHSFLIARETAFTIIGILSESVGRDIKLFSSVIKEENKRLKGILNANK